MFELRGATVVVTGGTGFLGTALTTELQRAGARAIPLGSSDYDLRDRAAAEAMLAATQPDGVVHLAAVVGGIGANRAEPGRFFYENALMGIQLLEACRIAAVPKVVVAGTVCAYPKHAPVPFREADLWNGYPEDTNAPYGLAKKMLLVQAQAYREQYGCNFVTLLPVNLYGPGDNFDLRTGHVIPAMIHRFVAARDAQVDEVVLWGDGSATREFLHVGDAARAFRLALEHYDAGDPVNVGSGEEISIAALARLVAELCGYDGSIAWDTSEPNGQPRRRLDTRRAEASFGFTASTELREGLQRTIEWYSDHLR